MARHTFRDVFRYRFDTFFARGGSSIFLTMTLVFLGLLALIAGGRAIILGMQPDLAMQHEGGVLLNTFITFLQMTDPGNMAQDIASSPLIKITTVLAGLVGVVMLSLLIGFITTTLDQKLSELKKGHSKVIEGGHTLILGWNDQRILEILRELFIANESENNPCVVILSKNDKEQMDDFLDVNMPDTKNTRVVTRSGNVSSLVNLETVALESCESIIVIAEIRDSATTEEKAASDARTIKTILAVMACRPEGKELNLIAEVFDAQNREIVKRLSPTEITVLDTEDILAKILVQTSRSVGLSVVYNEVLSFDGCEMYFYQANWGNVTFGEAGYRFPDGVPLGLRHGDGAISLNPPASTTLEPTDDILILAQDDSTIAFRQTPVMSPTSRDIPDHRIEPKVEKDLILGWTPKVDIIVEQYSDYVLKGSSIDIMVADATPDIEDRMKALKERTKNIKLNLIEADPLKSESLMAIEPFTYDNIIILSHQAKDHDPDRTDSETLIILLLLRKIFSEHEEEAASTKLITEVLDSENLELVARAGVNDFIISNRLISMLLAQISQSQDIRTVYDDLFEEEGSEIYLKPASLYFDDFPVKVPFGDFMAVAKTRNEICLGLKIKEHEHDLGRNFGVTLVPPKTKAFTINEDDALVVLSEDDT